MCVGKTDLLICSCFSFVLNVYDLLLFFQGTDYTTGLVASQYGMGAVYTGGENYVISRPPASTAPPSNLATELDSFYSDLAALEPQPPPVEPPLPPPETSAPVSSPPQPQPLSLIHI